ncbi:hypothetical protein ALQ32_200162 [Pseudomonas syringae pv. tagetis]|uniref:Uncharacterized protein n=1 Tax=Pseudomonas syringae pv. tagetis TaxID=129140 RepID=A0A3M3ZHG2_9PSED|nr:hypothetical protein ALQ32_200162 [Pseudomonas syringae pv. tagetis]
MGRIRNPLYLHRYLGFESLSLRHTNESPADKGLRGFFIFRFTTPLYYSNYEAHGLETLISSHVCHPVAVQHLTRIEWRLQPL